MPDEEKLERKMDEHWEKISEEQEFDSSFDLKEAEKKFKEYLDEVDDKQLLKDIDECDPIKKLQSENDKLRHKVEGYKKECHEVEQRLGVALGFPWFKDDQKNFPGTTSKDGVCVGDHVPGTLAASAADRITYIQDRLKELLSISKIVHSHLDSDLFVFCGGTDWLFEFESVIKNIETVLASHNIK